MQGRKKYYPSILIYDNESELANNIKLFLEDSYNVHNVNNIKYLILDLNTHSFDYVLLDFDSINKYFNEIIDTIRNKSDNTKILLMYTIFKTEKYNEQEILSKVDDFIFKPFNVELLKHKLEKDNSKKSKSLYHRELT